MKNGMRCLIWIISCLTTQSDSPSGLVMRQIGHKPGQIGGYTMYQTTVFCQLITGEWITTKTDKLELVIARGVYNRLSDKMYSQLTKGEILAYKVYVENAE